MLKLKWKREKKLFIKENPVVNVDHIPLFDITIFNICNGYLGSNIRNAMKCYTMLSFSTFKQKYKC